MRHQIAFRQYKPNKPHRYGLLVKSMYATKVRFTYKADPYIDKLKDGNDPCHTNALKITWSILWEKLRRILWLYTSISLSNCLLDRVIMTVGIPNTNQIGIPNEAKRTKDREEFSTTFHLNSSVKLCLAKSKKKKKYSCALSDATIRWCITRWWISWAHYNKVLQLC